MRFPKVLILFCLVLGCCRNMDVLTEAPWECPTSCYDGPQGTLGVGVCHGGTPVCDYDAGRVALCQGEVVPTQEVCNGLDDNCDGIVDDDVADAGQPCYTGPAGTENVGICQGGYWRCEGALGLLCVGEQLPQAETCNCLDNDCNGIVGDIPPDQFCYDGPQDTAGVGTCHPGVTKCGPQCRPYCAGEQLPAPDQCDGVDRECTGKPMTTQGLVDIVVMLDNTDITCEDGTSNVDFQAAQWALEQFAAQYQGSNFHFALVLMPGDKRQEDGWPSDGGAGVQVVQPLGSWQGFSTEVQQAQEVDYTQDPGCNDEPYYNLDVLYFQAQGLIVPWEAGAERVVVFLTNDEAEGYYVEPYGSSLTPVEVGSAYASAGAQAVLFLASANMGAFYGSGTLNAWTGGQQMLQDLNQDLTFACSPSAAPDGGTDAGVDGGYSGAQGCLCGDAGQTVACPCIQNGVPTWCYPPQVPIPNNCTAP